MKCAEIHNDLIFFFDDELTPERKALVSHHLKDCSECAAFLKELEASLLVIHQEKNAEINPFLVTRIEAKLNEQSGATSFQNWTLIPRRIVQPIFFSLLLIVAVYGGIRLGETAGAGTKEEQIENQLFLDDFTAEPIESFLIEQS